MPELLLGGTCRGIGERRGAGAPLSGGPGGPPIEGRWGGWGWWGARGLSQGARFMGQGVAWVPRLPGGGAGPGGLGTFFRPGEDFLPRGGGPAPGGGTPPAPPGPPP